MRRRRGAWPLSRDAGGRLADLAAAEAAATALPSGLPERLRAILAELRLDRIPLAIERLTLCDPREEWQPLFAEVIDAVAARGAQLDAWPWERARAAGDLGVAQRALAGEAGERPRAAGDGSLALVRGASGAEAADLAAALLAQQVERFGADEVAVIDSRGDGNLDEALARAGFALCGGSSASRGVDARQVLALTLLLQWRPADPYLVQQLVLLQDSPQPRDVRQQVLQALRETPGPRAWRGALDIETVDADAQLPVDRIDHACARVAAWAMRRAHAGEQSPERVALFQQVAREARLAGRAAPMRAPAFGRQELARLLADLAQAAPVESRTVREAGAPVAVASPGALLSAPAAVVWYGADGDALATPRRSFWSPAERGALAGAGVLLPDPDRAVAREMAAAGRAVGMTREAFTFVHAEATGDRHSGTHPVWHKLLRAFEERGREAALAFDGLELIGRGAAPGGAALTTARPDRPACLAGGRAVWQLPAGMEPRETESPSSLEKLVSCPFGYALRYGAGVADEDLYALADGSVALGTIAHAALERWLAEGLGADPGGCFDRVVAEEAALLLGPGRDVEREGARDAVIRSAAKLADVMARGALRPVGFEQKLSGQTEVGRVEGRADLVLQRGEDPEALAVIDLKWGSENFRRESLEQGRALQLAAYARLAGGRVAPTAYLILVTAELLTVHGDVFPGADVVLGDAEPEVWERMAAVAREQKAALAAGRVLVGSPEEPSEDDGLLVAAGCRFCGFALFCRVDAVEEAR